MRRLWLILAALVILAGSCVAGGTSADASHSRPDHWRKSADHYQLWAYLVLDFDSERYDWPIEHGVEVWSASSRLSVKIVSACPSYADACVQVNDEYKPNHYLGHTDVAYWPCDYPTTPPYPGRCHTVRAEVTFNSYYTMSAATLRYVICHELGHAWRLGHSTSADGCMYHDRVGGDEPSSHDYSTLVTKYGGHEHG